MDFNIIPVNSIPLFKATSKDIKHYFIILVIVSIVLCVYVYFTNSLETTKPLQLGQVENENCTGMHN